MMCEYLFYFFKVSDSDRFEPEWTCRMLGMHELKQC